MRRYIAIYCRSAKRIGVSHDIFISAALFSIIYSPFTGMLIFIRLNWLYYGTVLFLEDCQSSLFLIFIVPCQYFIVVKLAAYHLLSAYRFQISLFLALTI